MDSIEQIERIQASIVTLTGVTKELSASRAEEIERLGGVIERLGVVVRKLRRLYVWLGVVVAAIGLLAIVSAFQINELQEINELAEANQERLADNQERLDELQERTSGDVLCPLYDIFLASYKPESPQAKADPELYEASFKVIENGALTLGCRHVTRGAAPLPPKTRPP